MKEQTLIRKLLLTPEQRKLLYRAPRLYIRQLESHFEGEPISSEIAGEYDFAQLFVESLSELNQYVPLIKKALVFDGVFWVSYPKTIARHHPEMTRDRIWKEMVPYNFTPVNQISLDDIWFAIRFRPVHVLDR